MKNRLFTVSAALLLMAAGTSGRGQTPVEQKRTDATPRREQPGWDWVSTPPADCPFPRSDTIAGLRFTKRHAEYTGADTWYPSWATDGNLYSSFTDGTVDKTKSSSFNSGNWKATTGYATISGDDPLTLRVGNQGVVHGDPAPYGGRYPSGSLVHDGIWYYGTYCLDDWLVQHEGKTYNWPWLGPLVGFRFSKDFGKTWTEGPCTPAKPLFGEKGGRNGPSVRIGAPHFVDFGKNMQHSPDGKAYLVAHGTVDPDPKPRFGNNSWITGDQVFLLRVKPSPETINDASQYEFYAGQDAKGDVVWSRHLAESKPLIDWNNRCGCVTMTYNAPLKKYLTCVTDGCDTNYEMNTYFLESDRITGPWKLVMFLEKFGRQAYFVNVPSKFISADGRTAWLCYSANFNPAMKSDPPGSRYAMCLQEVRLLGPSAPQP